MGNVKRRCRGSAIFGVVTPTQWDTSGKVVTVAIRINDKEMIQVEHLPLGNALLNFINKEVRVVGKIRERINGKASIRVNSFQTVSGRSGYEKARAQKLDSRGNP